jgi:predicted GH43/DUF377 family glycosyl hydrolase
MHIYDLTKLLKFDAQNYYCFNNSIQHYKDNIFIMTYRVIKYNVEDDNIYHPWKIWSNGYEIFKKEKSKLMELNEHLNVNTKLYSLAKYRNNLGGDMFIGMKHKYDLIDEDLYEYDSTGLAILQFKNNTWSLIYNINNIFAFEMNQDARIYKIDNEFYITYNMFMNIGDIYHVKMAQRKLDINVESKYIYIYPEVDMLQGINYKNVEKNCILNLNKDVLYNINGTFEYIINNELIIKDIEPIQKMIKLYGSNNIIFSLGTPVIKYGNNNLSVGHVKIDHNKKYSWTPFEEFYNNIDFTDINKHGKYIYFMFLFEFDNDYNILRISDCFIPTQDNCHFPYYLVFPTGLQEWSDNIMISYGEGDVKSKVVIFSKDEIEKLFSNYGNFLLLDNTFFTNKTMLHLGYFGKYNCGDDAFVSVFKWLNKTYYPNYNIEFSEYIKSYKKYDTITLGGGDVINDYFMDKIPVDTVHGVGVGIPYKNMADKISKFKTCIIRNNTDLTELKQMFPDKLIEHYPDLVFLFSKMYTDLTKTINNKIKIGLCLTRTFYKKGYEKDYIQFVLGIVNIINYLVGLDYQVYLIPFCINLENSKENDTLLNTHIMNLIDSDNVINIYDLPDYDRNNYVEHTFRFLNNMDFNICSRFHAHIFSTILKVPFISLTCSRKCSQYMKENNLSEHLIPLETNEIDLPINFNSNKIIPLIEQQIKNRDTMKEKLIITMDNMNIKMNEFIEYYMKTIIR